MQKAVKDSGPGDERRSGQRDDHILPGERQHAQAGLEGEDRVVCQAAGCGSFAGAWRPETVDMWIVACADGCHSRLGDITSGAGDDRHLIPLPGAVFGQRGGQLAGRREVGRVELVDDRQAHGLAPLFGLPGRL